MFSGYWIVQWEDLERLPVKLKETKTISILSLLVKARSKKDLPLLVLVPGLDTLLSLAEDHSETARIIREILASAPTSRWRSSVIILVVDKVELNAEWWLRLRRGAVDRVAIRSIFPRAELQVVTGLNLCYSPITLMS